MKVKLATSCHHSFATFLAVQLRAEFLQVLEIVALTLALFDEIPHSDDDVLKSCSASCRGIREVVSETENDALTQRPFF